MRVRRSCDTQKRYDKHFILCSFYVTLDVTDDSPERQMNSALTKTDLGALWARASATLFAATAAGGDAARDGTPAANLALSRAEGRAGGAGHGGRRRMGGRCIVPGTA